MLSICSSNRLLIEMKSIKTKCSLNLLLIINSLFAFAPFPFDAPALTSSATKLTFWSASNSVSAVAMQHLMKVSAMRVKQTSDTILPPFLCMLISENIGKNAIELIVI